MNNIKNIKPDEFLKLTSEPHDFIIIDCRTKGEIENQCLEHNFNIDLYDSSSLKIINDLNPDSKYIIYCQSGGRSQYLCDYLISNGFKNIYNLEGGILNWNYYKNRNLI